VLLARLHPVGAFTPRRCPRGLEGSGMRFDPSRPGERRQPWWATQRPAKSEGRPGRRQGGEKSRRARPTAALEVSCAARSIGIGRVRRRSGPGPTGPLKCGCQGRGPCRSGVRTPRGTGCQAQVADDRIDWQSLWGQDPPRGKSRRHPPRTARASNAMRSSSLRPTADPTAVLPRGPDAPAHASSARDGEGNLGRNPASQLPAGNAKTQLQNRHPLGHCGRTGQQWHPLPGFSA